MTHQKGLPPPNFMSWQWTDDSTVDRKVIERLLKISAYKEIQAISASRGSPMCREGVGGWIEACAYVCCFSVYNKCIVWEGDNVLGCFGVRFIAVTTVDSGRRALEFLGLDEEHNSVNIDDIKVNMIITDYCMPGMTGYDLLKRIKESSTLKEIPVVIMSSENVLARVDRCLEGGAEEFILKPVKLADVKRLKGHIVKGQSKDQQQQPPPTSAKRKVLSENLENLQSQPSERRPRLGELTVA